MLHRATWFAIPIVGLVVLGSATGWWGYNQYQQRQALALQTEGEYSAAFHGLVSDVDHLQEELGKSIITSDPAAFQTRLRNVWRLSFSAQSEVGRLPFELMPMHNSQQFLALCSHDSETWLKEGKQPDDKGVNHSLQTLYQQSKQMASNLNALQAKVTADRLQWVVANEALTKSHQDNQIVDGFRKIDTSAAAYEESNDDPATTVRGRTKALADEPTVTVTQARQAFTRLVGTGLSNVNVAQTKKGAYVPMYQISAVSPAGNVSGSVSVHGGHAMTFHLDESTNKPGVEDLLTAQTKAESWLRVRGFPSVYNLASTQFDHTGYFVFVPNYKGVPILSQTMSVKVNLATNHVIDYDAKNVYFYPVKGLPDRKFSTKQLEQRLNPQFHVGFSQPVIVLDENGRYQPAVAFYGTSNKETYRLYMNAATGNEIDVEQLTDHDQT